MWVITFILLKTHFFLLYLKRIKRFSCPYFLFFFSFLFNFCFNANLGQVKWYAYINIPLVSILMWISPYVPRVVPRPSFIFPFHLLGEKRKKVQRRRKFRYHIKTILSQNVYLKLITFRRMIYYDIAWMLHIFFHEFELYLDSKKLWRDLNILWNL